jgi:hypothetical protein
MRLYSISLSCKTVSQKLPKNRVPGLDEVGMCLKYRAVIKTYMYAEFYCAKYFPLYCTYCTFVLFRGTLRDPSAPHRTPHTVHCLESERHVATANVTANVIREFVPGRPG